MPKEVNMPRDKSERNVRIVNEYLTDLPARVLEQVASGGCVCPPARVRDMSPAPTPLKKGEPFSPAEMLVCSLFVALKPRTGGKRKRDVHPLGVLAPDQGAKKNEDYGGVARPRLSEGELASRIESFRKRAEQRKPLTEWDEELDSFRQTRGLPPLMEKDDYPPIQAICRLAMWDGEKGLCNRDIKDTRRSDWQSVVGYALSFGPNWDDDDKEFIKEFIKREYRK
jgi:hypothetical protein